MISINIPNVITIGLISLLVLAATRWGLRTAGINTTLV